MDPAPDARTDGRRITGPQVRSVLLGESLDGVRIVRQARRLTEGDSDELLLIDARGTWWVARRASDRVTLWVYVGDVEADDGFDQLVEASRRGEADWEEVAQNLLQP